MNPTRFVSFVVARHLVSLAKEAGQSKPWTDDPILRAYRFCNVYRERDTVTKWIRENWSTKYRHNDELWFAMVVARLINWPATLARLEPVPWLPNNFKKVLQVLAHDGHQVFGPAYIVSTNGRAIPKPVYLADHVLTPMWGQRAMLRPRKGDTLAGFHRDLMHFQGMGSFMAAQVVADVKNSPGGGLDDAPDWWEWCAPGPGSLRGLNRLLGRGAVRTGIHEDVFRTYVNDLRLELNGEFVDRGWVPLCAQDVQNCLCEYDKYERVRLGEGKPRQRYPGG